MHMIVYDGELQEAVPYHTVNGVSVGLRFHCREEEGGSGVGKVTIVMSIEAVEEMKRVLMKDRVRVEPDGKVRWREWLKLGPLAGLA